MLSKNKEEDKLNKFRYGEKIFCRLMSHPSQVKIWVDIRGCGKTFLFKKYMLERSLKHGEQFMYVVDTQEMRDALTANNGLTFFNGLKEYFDNKPNKKETEIIAFLSRLYNPDEKSTMVKKNGAIYHRGVVIGYIQALSSYMQLKRNDFVVKNILYDEFLPDKVTGHNIYNDEKLKSLLFSVGRTRDVKLFLLSNTTTRKSNMYNFLKLDKIPMGNTKHYNKRSVHIGSPDDKDFRRYREEVKKSIVGDFIDAGNEKLFNQKYEDKDITKAIKKGDVIASFIHGEGYINIYRYKDRLQVFRDEENDGQIITKRDKIYPKLIKIISGHFIMDKINYENHTVKLLLHKIILM